MYLLRNLLTLVLLVVAVASTTLWVSNSSVNVEEVAAEVYESVKSKLSLGASPGPEHYSKQFFYEGYESGSPETSYASTTVSGNATFLASELANDYIELTPTVGAVTLTITATTSSGFPLGFEFGAKRVIEFYNATSTTGVASIITFAGGTGIDLQEDEGETVTLNGLEVARLTLIRKNDSDVLAWVEVGQVGD